MAAKKTVRRGASTTKKSAGRKDIPGWLWLGAGVTIGVLVTLLVNLAPDASVDARTVAGSTGTGEIVSKKKPSPEKKPVFDFYTLLPESEVMVSNEAKHASAASPKSEKPVVAKVPTEKQAPVTVEAKPNRRYLLQAGSFRNPDDADRLRAQLLLWGLDARVERVIVKGGDAWHRVQLGPFTEQSSLNEARQTLVAHKIDSLMLQLK
ncbi:SPOR domain-containing protein [Kistimonas asteriae]|uniref:SPOR domain-containing protein n=1 Tax=Kistimonas asteriae TaxID=517724 RepID=UPI001BAB7E46|nr:SPOR domain-containing protein [Kistimonas asteriae]